MAGTNVDGSSVLHPDSFSPKAKAAISKSKQGQVVTGKVTDAGAKRPVVAKNEFYTKKVFTAPSGSRNVTRSNKV